MRILRQRAIAKPRETAIDLRMLAIAVAASMLAILLHVSSLFAAYTSKSAGTSGAAFLKIGAGARPTAMGEAYTAVADDANAIYWNTAGLAQLRKNEFTAMRAELFQDVQYNFFAFAHPTQRWGTFAIGLNNMNVADIEQRSGDTDNPDSKFSANDTVYTLAYAVRPAALRGMEAEGEDGGMHFGVSLKLIHQTLSGNTANSMAGDLGALYRFSERPLSLALAVQNLGSKVKFKNESDPLPLTIKLGTSYRLGQDWVISGVKTGERRNGLLLALDGHLPRDNDPSARLGMEYTYGWTENLASSARAGYQTGRSRQIEGATSGISAGAGLTYRFFTFDFAWTPFGDLGNAFRYSVKLKF